MYDEINSARFQAQVEPLLVILRESRRSWRAATWLVNFLSRKIGEREETPEEAESRQQQEIDEARRARQERAAEEQARAKAAQAEKIARKQAVNRAQYPEDYAEDEAFARQEERRIKELLERE